MADDTAPWLETEILETCPSLVRALEISLITDRILSYLSTSDVLQCSLVSEFWRKICRRYLRRRECFEIYLETNSCAQLEKLDDMLKYASDLPFVGSKLSLDLCYTHCTPHFRNNIYIGPKHPDVLCFSEENKDVEMLYSNIFKKLPVKNLRIDFCTDFFIKDCNCENVLKKLLVRRAHDTTEYLEILFWPKEYQSFWKYLNIPQHSEDSTALHQSNLFQSLRTCNLRNFAGGLREYEELISAVITSSPVLENIYGSVPNLFLPLSDDGNAANHYGCQLPRNRLPIIRDVTASSRKDVTLLLAVEPKLARFEFDPRIIIPSEGETENDVKAEVQKSLTTIIEKCSSSLMTLVCSNLTYLLPRAINIVLFNCVVLKLHISPPYQEFDDNLLFLKAINYSVFLPNLRCADFVFKKALYVEQITRKKIKDKSSLFTCAKFACFSVNTIFLTFEGHDEKIKSLYKIADLFPNVKSLHLDHGNTSTVPEKVFQVGLPWNDNLEVISCCFSEIRGTCFWRILTELLENLCDIFIEELLAVNCNNFAAWSYAPTRRVLFNHRGSSRIILKLNHNRGCSSNWGIEPDTYTQYKTRFDLISAWIRAKMPEFSLTLKFKPCLYRKFYCNPLHFYSGKIRKEKYGPFGNGCGFETWHFKL